MISAGYRRRQSREHHAINVTILNCDVKKQAGFNAIALDKGQLLYYSLTFFNII